MDPARQNIGTVIDFDYDSRHGKIEAINGTTVVFDDSALLDSGLKEPAKGQEVYFEPLPPSLGVVRALAVYPVDGVLEIELGSSSAWLFEPFRAFIRAAYSRSAFHVLWEPWLRGYGGYVDVGGQDPDDGGSPRLPVEIYLSSEKTAAETESALSDLLETFGFDVIEREPPLLGSFFRKIWVSPPGLGEKDELHEIAGQLKQAIVQLQVQQLEINDLQRRLSSQSQRPPLPITVREAAARQAGESERQSYNASLRLIAELSTQDDAVVAIGTLMIMVQSGRIAVVELTDEQFDFLLAHADGIDDPRQLLQILSDINWGS